MDRFSALLDPLPTPAYVVDLHGCVVYANAAAFRVWAVPANYVGPAVASVFPLLQESGDALPFNETPAGQLLSGAPIAAPRLVRVKGGAAFIASANPWLDEAGTLAGAIALFSEVKSPDEGAQLRTRFLLEAGRALGSSLDLSTTLSELARLIVPRMADWCIVAMADEEGVLRRLAVTCSDDAQTALARELASHPVSSAMPSMQAMRRQEPRLWREFTSADVASISADEAEAALVRRLCLTSAIAVPLNARGHVLGSLTLASTSPTRLFDQLDLEVMTVVASRAALAIDHARLYRESQQARVQSERQAARLFVLSEASRVLAEAGFDFETAYRTIVRYVCEHIGDACVLTVANASGQQRPVAIDHRHPLHRERLFRTTTGGPPGSGLGLAGPVYATGRAMRLAVVPPEVLAEVSASRPLVAEYLRDIGISSMLVVPLRNEGKVIGTLGVARDGGGAPYNEEDEALLQDLADRAALVIDKARLYREAQEALQLRESFLSIASHELRTPLSAMRLQVQSQLRHWKRTAEAAPQPIVDRFEALDTQISRLALLVDELLDVTRITRGRLRLEPEEFDLAALAREVAERFAPIMLEAGCAFAVTVSASVVGRWDRSRVDQVVTNLLSNAAKYGRSKPVELRVESREGRAIVTVRDEGIGIAPEHQQRIFERFERGVSSRNYSGFGLGLWIARGLARAHGGEIHVTSAPGAGSTFVLELPLSRSSSQSSP